MSDLYKDWDETIADEEDSLNADEDAPAQYTSPAPTIEGFTYVGRLGGGGFADVYRYRDTLSRDVAVKVLRTGMDEDAFEKFEREATLMAQLSSHPNIVTIYQFGKSEDGRPFLVMEMYPGGSLVSEVNEKPYAYQDMLAMGVQIAGAIETAHQFGVLHRDIKPGNILFNRLGHPALTDFGISVSFTAQESARGAMSPQWAPPEQFKITTRTDTSHPQEDKPDLTDSPAMGAWSDVYSLAATLWACLVGHSPVWVPGEPNDMLTLRQRVFTMAVPRIRRNDVPADVENVLRKALSKDPNKRYQTALDFARALQRLQAAHNLPITPVEVLSEDGEVKGAASGLSDLAQARARSSAQNTAQSPEQISTLVSPPPTASTSKTNMLTDAHLMALGQADAYKGGQGAYSQKGTYSQTGAYLQQGIYQQPGVYASRGIPDMPSMGHAGARAPQPAPVKRSKTPVVIGIVLALLVLIGILLGVFWLMNSDTADTEGKDTLDSSVPSVVSLEGRKKGDTVTFTWGNPDQMEGDSYAYSITGSAGDDSEGTTTEATVTVAADDGEVCIDVQLVRSDGRTGLAEQKCVQ